MKIYLLPVAALLALSACGGGSDSSGPANPSPSADAFFTVVQATTATSSENGEPTSIDAITATAPNDSEPTAI